MKKDNKNQKLHKDQVGFLKKNKHSLENYQLKKEEKSKNIVKVDESLVNEPSSLIFDNLNSKKIKKNSLTKNLRILKKPSQKKKMIWKF